MDNIKFGNFICELRKAKGLTQKELAEIINITDKAISKWERGISFPDICIWESLASALDISIVELIKCQKEPNPNPETAELLTNAINISKSKIKKYKIDYFKKIIKCSIIILLLIAIFNLFKPEKINKCEHFILNTTLNKETLSSQNISLRSNYYCLK